MYEYTQACRHVHMCEHTEHTRKLRWRMAQKTLNNGLLALPSVPCQTLSSCQALSRTLHKQRLHGSLLVFSLFNEHSPRKVHITEENSRMFFVLQQYIYTLQKGQDRVEWHSPVRNCTTSIICPSNLELRGRLENLHKQKRPYTHDPAAFEIQRHVTHPLCG